MSSSSDRRQLYKLSRHVVAHQLASNRYALWNALFPSVLLVDNATWHRLRQVPLPHSEMGRTHLKRLVDYRILYRGEADPYEQEFFESAESALAELDAIATQFYGERQSYRTLGLVNSGCNLGCSYCVSYKGDEFRTQAARVADKGSERASAIKNVIDQFMQRKVHWGDTHATFAFSGGEILLRWSLLEPLIRYAKDAYPSIAVHCEMNTNATLITEEVARSLNELGIGIFVSIDGYRDAHNKTRVYHGGRTSFDNVLQGIQLYNKYSPEDRAVRGFQGTVEDVDEFDMSQLFRMSDSGFNVARLAPNLLQKPADHGNRAADWEATMVAESQTESLATSDTHFEKVYAKLGTLTSGFEFNCNGLRGVAARILTLNVDSMQLSQMCSFSSPAALTLGELGYDIYNPQLWLKSREYIADRINMLRTECAGCDVLGVCQGACVNNGLDLANRLNPASCAYQRKMWRHAIDYAFDGTVRREPSSSEAHPVDNGQSACCSSLDPSANAHGSTQKKWTLTPV